MKLLWDQCKDKSMLLTFINNHRYINQAKFIPRKDQKKKKEILTIFPLYGGELSIFLSIFLGFFFSTFSLMCTTFIMEIALLY